MDFKNMTKIVDPVVNVNEVSRLAQGVVIKGDISSASDIRVDGQLEGKLYSDGRIVVGETANLKGSLVCSDVDFWGKMEGDLYVKNVLSVKGTAVINGNIHVRKLQVEMGAQINGTCKMISEDEFSALADEVITVKAPEPVKKSRKEAPAAREIARPSVLADVEPEPEPVVEPEPEVEEKEEERPIPSNSPFGFFKKPRSPFDY